MLSPLAFELPTFLIGLLFGSFLNVCISRLPGHRSISKPRSHCPNCLATIRWYDNIPLLSWLILRARCRNCKMPISWRYPAVELAVGLFLAVLAESIWGNLRLFALEETTLSLNAGNRDVSMLIMYIGCAILGFLLIGLLVMDWQTHTLPDAFTFPGIMIGFVLICCRAVFLAPGEYDIVLNPRHSLRMSSPGSYVAKGNVFMTGPEHLVLGRLLAIAAAAGIILLIRFTYQKLRHREGLGLGDAKLLAMIAAFLGFWPAVFALFVGVVLCGTYAVILLARNKATATTRLPFGSFLSIGGLISALVGTSVIAWYTSLL
jgi:leader peptidase (prepilin peptidase)/N-methyltransferase